MVTLVQSKADKKSYRYLQLENGLSVLLIHDPAVAAAGLKGDATEEGVKQQQQAADGGDASMSEADDDSEGSDEEDEESQGGSSDGSSSSDGGSSEGDEGTGSEAPGASKKAAAAMAVGVGSFSDPMEMQGLAHYLEHMLFMGSEKYPDENEYDAYLNNHGGGSNAYTELEYTNYHFDVAPAHLEGALDRLAQFFVKPLFLAGSLEREVQAVDSEFKGVLQSDHSRLAQLMCHTCRAGHVYNKFSWGNLLSLWEQPKQAGLDVRQHIIDFYRRTYSAERMSLVVLGGDSLDTLQEWVSSSFGDIPRGTAGPPESFQSAGLPFEGRRLYLAPAVKDHHEVTVTFQLPCLRPNYPNKPEHYISHLVGHEGPGSLTSALKARGWALELCAGIDDDGYSFNTASYLFTVNIVLTEAGLTAGPGYGLAPVGLLFNYLKLLTNTGPQQWVYDELRAISDMKFRFMQEEDSCDYVTRLSATMGWVEPQHLLVANYLHDNWQPDRVVELLGLMHPTNSNYRIDLLTKSFDTLKQQLMQRQQQQNITSAVAPPNGTPSSSTAAAAAAGGSVCELHEPWFDMDAVQWELPDSLTSSWSSADIISTDLALPPPNPYVATDFTLKGPPPAAAAAAAGGDGAAASEVDKVKQQQQEEIAALPRWVLSPVGGRPSSINVLLSSPPDMILDQPGVRLWHKCSVGYGQPRLMTYWRLSSPVSAASARASVLAALWLRLVEEAQAEDTYLADVSGLHWSSCPEGVWGLEVRVDGFNHKLDLLAHRVFEALAAAQVKSSSFPAVVEELMRRYKNALLKPSHAANLLRLQLLSGGPCWSQDELAAALAGVKGVEEVQAFAAEFLSHCHLEALILGNATAAEAAALCQHVTTALNTPAAAAAAAAAAAQPTNASSGGVSSGGLTLPAVDRPVEVCVCLPAGVEVLHQVAARNPEEDNCCVEVYYQVGLSSDDVGLRVLTDLVEQVISEPLYDTLRTKQQLGYTVSSGARLTHGVTGFCVVVVSAAFDAATVEARIEAFMDDFLDNRLKVMTDDEFARHKSSLISNKLQTDMSLGQEGDTAWEQVFNTRYEFVTREQEAVLLQSITLQQLTEFYASHLAPSSPNRRKLCVRVIPTHKQQHQQQPAAVQDHVQHEFGVLHPQGEHLHHNKEQQQQQQQQVVEADEGHTPTAAAGVGGGDTPKSKRVRRQQDGQQQQQQEGGQQEAGAAEALKAVQVASVQVVSDVRAFKAAAARCGVYTSVQPELAAVRL